MFSLSCLLLGVPRSLFETRGWATTSSPGMQVVKTTSSPGMQVVNPSTQHIPTHARLCEPSSATSGWLSGVSAGWPWRLSDVSAAWPCLISAAWPWVISAVWPSGLSPHGAASFVHARLGYRGNQGSMVSKLPSPGPHTCSRPPVVPHVPSPPPGLRLPFWRASWCSPSTGGVGLRATAAGRRECDRAVTWTLPAMGVKQDAPQAPLNNNNWRLASSRVEALRVEGMS